MPAPLSDEDIKKVFAAGMNPRARLISKYQRYFDGTVYEGRIGFLDGSDKPLTERAPCVIYPGVRNAVTAFSSMCLGDKRFPTMTTLGNEDDSVFDDRLGLTKEQSTILDAFLGKISEQSRLPAKAQQILEVAMSSGTAVPLAAVIKGRLTIKLLDPKVCWPEFEEDGVTLAALEERYIYADSNVWSKSERKFETRVYQYRRRIDATSDVVFEPLEITAVEMVPECLIFPEAKQTAEKKRFVHNFNFCPALWYRFLETVSDSAQIDGRPIHWGLLSLCDAVNFGLSQRFRAALYCGDPQPWETGVDDENPVNAPGGRLSGAMQSSSGLEGWNTPAGNKMQAGVRKKGPNTMWSYPNPESKVGLLALTGDSLKPLADDVSDNRRTLRESLGHVELDTAALSKSELSGAAIEEMKAPQVAVCNKIREDFGANCLLPLVNLLLRVSIASGSGLYLAGAKKAIPILKRFYQEIGTASAPANDTADSPTAPAKAASPKTQWFDPTIKLAWGAYSETSDTEQQMRVNTAAVALEKGLATHKSAVEKVKGVFTDVNNTDQYMVTLKKEIADRKAAESADLHGAIGAMNDAGQPNDAGGTGSAGGAGGPDQGAISAGGSSAVPGSTAAAADVLAARSLSDQGLKKGAKGTLADTPIHDRSMSTAGVVESVFNQLAEDYPKDTLAWVRAAAWTGPQEVPLDSIDYSNRDEWAASDAPERVQFFIDKIKDGDKKPIILVNEPNNRKLIIIDGHHRALAYEKLGMPAYAYVAEVGTVTGEWDVLHDSQRKGGKKKSSLKDDKAA